MRISALHVSMFLFWLLFFDSNLCAFQIERKWNRIYNIDTHTYRLPYPAPVNRKRVGILVDFDYFHSNRLAAITKESFIFIKHTNLRFEFHFISILILHRRLLLIFLSIFPIIDEICLEIASRYSIIAKCSPYTDFK